MSRLFKHLTLASLTALLLCRPSLATDWETVRHNFTLDLDRLLKGPQNRKSLFPGIRLHPTLKTQLMIVVSLQTWQDTQEQRRYMLAALFSLWGRHCGKYSGGAHRCQLQIHDVRGRFVAARDEKGIRVE